MSLVSKHQITDRIFQQRWSDKICVQNLDVVVNAGTDVWGRQKSQRARVSVTLTLKHRFASAASTDSVDQSTVHYGTLSKAIQTHVNENNERWRSTYDLVGDLKSRVRNVAGSTMGAVEVDVFYPKGSMFGDGVGYNFSEVPSENIHTPILYLQNVRIPCIIGVNSNERLQKQPVVVNLWAEGISMDRVDEYAKLETLLSNLISETSFQTIESMLEWVMQQLREKFFNKDTDKSTVVRLRIEKPMAVPFADAPAVEITRAIAEEVVL